MRLGKVVVGVDLPPGRAVRPHVEYPSQSSECEEVNMPRKDDDVENYGDQEEVLPVSMSASVGKVNERRKEGLTDGEDELVVEF